MEITISTPLPQRRDRGQYHKPAHEKFIRHMQRHGDATRAYRAAYPKAKKESARVGGIRLFALPHIYSRVAPALQQMQQQAREQAQAAAAKRHALEQEEYYAMRVFLARIVRGEIPKRRVIRYAMRYLIVEETLSPFLTLRAIELDSKLEAWERVTPLFRRQFLRIMQQARKLHHAHLLPTAVPPHAGLPPTVLRECLPPLRPSLKEGGDELSGNTIVQNTDQTVILSAANAGGARDTGESIKVHQSHHPHHSSDKMLENTQLPVAIGTVTFSAATAGGARDTGDNIIAHQNHQPHHSSDKLPEHTIIEKHSQTVANWSANAVGASDTGHDIIAHQNHQPHHSSDNHPPSLTQNHHPPDKTCISPDAPRVWRE